MIIQCNNCGIEFKRRPSNIKEQNFCSLKCKYEGYAYTKEQRDNWAKKARLQKGSKRSEQTRINIAKSKSGAKNPNWKGDSVGYKSLHEWVSRNWGKAEKCEVCGVKDSVKYEWANLNNIYNRDRNNWKQMCCSCHQRYDNKINNLKEFIDKKQKEINKRNPEIIKLYQDGVKVSQIADKFNLSNVSIYRIIKL